MSGDRTWPADIEPISRTTAEIKITGAQLLDIIEERDAALARVEVLVSQNAELRAAVKGLRGFAQQPRVAHKGQ